MRCIRIDNAVEQTSRKFQKLISSNKIVAETTVSFAIQPNGSEEHLIQKLWKMTRSMLLDLKLSEKLWAEVISHFDWHQNRLFSSTLHMGVPFTAWRHIEPDLS